MKKILYSLAAVATLLFAASCAKDKETALPDYLMGGSPVEVTFGVNAGQGLMTKAIADGLTATKLTVGWYEVTDNGAVYCDKKDANLANLSGDVTLTLLKGKTYKIVFWAAPVEGSPYELDWNNNEVVGSSTLTANDEKNDAFYAVAEYEVLAQNEAQVITLTRPLAQIAVISPKANIDDNEAQLDDSGIVVAAAPTKMNLLTGETSTNAEITFTNAAPALEALTWKQEDYYYVAVGYVFAPANGAVSDISFNANNQEATTYDVQSASLKRNYRTVIAGNILPAADPNADVEWTVTVDPSFGGENEANMEAQVPEVTFTDPDDPQADPLPAPYDENLDVNESMDLDPDTPTAMFQVNSPSAAPIQVASDNEEVATAEIDGENMVTITAVGNGQALITISQDAYQEAANPAPGLHKAPGDNYAAYSYTFLVKVEGMETPEPPQPGEGFTFEKVTAISAGEYLIVYEEGSLAFDGSLETLDAIANYIEVTIANDKIELENKNSVFTIAAMDGGYSVKSASGLYISHSADANGLTAGDAAVANTITFDNEQGALITGAAGAVLRYNSASNQTRFRYYKAASYTNQKPVALYKLSDGTTPEPPQPGEPADAVITLSGVPTEALAAGASFDLVVSTESTGEIAVAADPAEAVTIAPKANADNTWTVTAAELEADTEVTLTVTTAAVENTWKAGEETATFTVAKKTGGDTPPATEYDFTSVAELNALAAAESAEKKGTLNGAVVSYVNGKSAFIKDDTGTILLFKDGHGLKQGQTFTGELNVTITLYHNCSELTACDAAFVGEETAVEPESVTLAQLTGNLATYQNAYVKVDDLTVTNVNGKNIDVTDGTNTYVVYAAANNACNVGDVISVVGTIAWYGDKDQIKAWSNDDITVTSQGEVTTVLTFATTASVYVGATKDIHATCNAANAVITYTSSDSNVASVDENGVITGVAAGTATITASVAAVPGSYTAASEECLVTVSVPSSNVTEYTESVDQTYLAANQNGSIGDISYTNDSDYGSNTVTELRVYKGKTLTFTVPANVTLKEIVLTCTANGTTKQGPGCFGEGAPNGYTFDANGPTGTWTGSVTDGTVTFTATDNQVRISAISVTYDK